MPIKPLYLDFFKFLDHVEKDDPWLSYQTLYIQPHQKFFEAYFGTFEHFDPAQISERVRKIKAEDYSQLRALIQLQDPLALAEEALKQSRAILPLNPEPPVYLFVGFFSADGATLMVEGAPSIALGLERFKDFKDLALLVAHEYCHGAERLLLKSFSPAKERPLFYSIIAEGLSVLFSEMVYPEIPLHRHLFLTRERLQWCLENQEVLLELAGADLASEKLIPILFGPGDANAGIPPRVGYFVARQMLGHCLTHHGAEDFGREFPGFEELFRKIIQEGRM
ncbi:MAG: hypothetical protein FJ117_20120 [Deltaproteobacteria bacterium]|nr:hypothetical protein [Deltaproteobacteria bacterium]